MSSDESASQADTNIPLATFVEDVDAYMASTGHESVEKTLRALDEHYNTYKMLEQSLTQKKKKLKQQIPDYKITLDLIEQLASQNVKKKESEAEILLSEQVYVRAAIPPTDKVCLWLGANVMMEYSLKEAADLITKNDTTAKSNLKKIESDLEILRDQLTITEVNMARIYNWDVVRRKAAAGPSTTS